MKSNISKLMSTIEDMLDETPDGSETYEGLFLILLALNEMYLRVTD